MAAAIGRAREQSRAIVGANLANTRISEEQVSLLSSQHIDSDEERPADDMSKSNFLDHRKNSILSSQKTTLFQRHHSPTNRYQTINSSQQKPA